MHTLIDTMTARPRIVGRALVAAGVATAVVALAAPTGSADPPPAGAGNDQSRLRRRDGVVRRSTIPARPPFPPPRMAGRHGTTGINDRGEILGATKIPTGSSGQFLRDRRAATPWSRSPILPAGAARRVPRHQQPRRIVGCYNDAQGSHDHRVPAHHEGRFINIQVPGSQSPGRSRSTTAVRSWASTSTPTPSRTPTARAGRYHPRLRAGRRRRHDRSTCRAPPPPSSSGSTTMGTWSALTSTPTAATTASCATARRRHHPPRRPAPTRRAEEHNPPASTTAARSPGSPMTLRADHAAFCSSAAASRRSPPPPPMFTRPLDINNRGQIVGDYAHEAARRRSRAPRARPITSRLRQHGDLEQVV